MQTLPIAPWHGKSALIAVASLATAAGALFGTAGAATTTPCGSWPYPNANLANTRVAPDSVISAANVAGLRQAWSFKITGEAAKGVSVFGSLAGTPVVTAGVVYFQDLYANVYALSLATGKLIWEYRLNSPLTESLGPDGVAVTGGVVWRRRLERLGLHDPL